MTNLELDIKVEQDVRLCRDHETGIAWVEDRRNGLAHSCHPNIHYTGSVPGMIKRGYWTEGDLFRRVGDHIYNISIFVVSSEFDELAAIYCECRACLKRKLKEQHERINNIRDL